MSTNFPKGNGGPTKTTEEEQQHHWGTRPPLLPPRLATLVSAMSGATRLSLEITALFWEAVFETIAESTNGGLWLGSAAWNEARLVLMTAANLLSPLTAFNPQIVTRTVQVSMAAGITVINQSVGALEHLLEGGFAAYTNTVNMGLHAAGEYVRLIDALFGSTDTSRVLASFIHMWRRETYDNNPEIRALISQHGIVGFCYQVIKTIAAWICLQVVTRGRSQIYRLETVATNVDQRVFCQRRYVDAEGCPIPATDRPECGNMQDHMSGQETPVAADDSEGANSDDGEYYPLSDQEAPHTDPEWDQRLMDALHALSLRTDRQRETELNQRQPRKSRSSLWSTLSEFRNANTNGTQNEEDTSSSSSSSSSSALVHGRVSPAFESAPASLFSSPQFTPIHNFGDEYRPRSRTVAETTMAVMPQESEMPFIQPTAVSEEPQQGRWMQQEFPRKPLLFNLARFITISSSAYGHAFLKILRLSHSVIDSRALIEEFGDYEVYSRRSSISPNSSTASLASSHSRRLSSVSLTKLPRAQPMSTYHTHSAYNPSRPGSQRQYERRHFRSPNQQPASRNGMSRRAPIRRHNYRRRPVTEHPNHYSFVQHTGIPLSDLLFSSYVSPIVPGVSRAANAKASEVERKIRSKQHSRKPSAKPEEPTTADKSWMSSIPIVGSIYQNLPSVPSIFSRSTASNEETSAKKKNDNKDLPSLGQFRRFDRIRRRLVYRNPSVHALVHYISVDHATRSVVLACRGTLGISDLFIDMICEYQTIHLPNHPHSESNEEFRVHSGMWHSAQMLANSSSEVFREVAEALRLYPEYGLVLTGHSLGGGVASLLTLLWSQPLFTEEQPIPPTPGSVKGSLRQFVTVDKFGLVSKRPIHCFSFGSPCSTNETLSVYCRGLVTSVANANDLISLLSIGSCVDILNMSAVLDRERGVAENVVRRFVKEKSAKIGKKLNPFDFDFSKLRIYANEDSDEEEEVIDVAEETTGYWWSRKTEYRNVSSPTEHQSKRQKKEDDQRHLDDWHWSLVKTLRANMDSEKLYPPGDVFVLAGPGDDQVADKHLVPLASSKKEEGLEEPVGLFYCPDVTERFSELRFSRNMLAHHVPSTYERRISALVHGGKRF